MRTRIAVLATVLALFALTPSPSKADAAINLTGAWQGDDGAVYYVRHVGDQIWWAGFSRGSNILSPQFFDGVGFTNVFRGTLVGTRITGTWVDVPRGTARGAGTLVLDLSGNIPGGHVLRKVSATGGFGATTWRDHVDVPITQCSNNEGQRYLRCAFDHVKKNDGGSFYDNLKPEIDYFTAWGWATTGLTVNYPDLAHASYADFIDAWDKSDQTQDGDLTLNFLLDRGELDARPGFWSSGWMYSDGPSVVQSKLRVNKNGMHAEIPMYGRSDANHPPLLPGWHESNGNSTLWNGLPINGVPATITTGKRVRIVGVLALDCGHFSIWSLSGNCEDDERAEIHPVYSLDVVQDWTTRDSRENLTGVWAADDMGTYYVRQVGSEVWWLGLSDDQGRSFANVFHGTIRGYSALGPGLHARGGSGVIIDGQWADVPLGATTGGPSILSLAGSPCIKPACNTSDPIKLSMSQVGGGFGGRNWEKLYDVLAPGTPPPLLLPAAHP